MLLFEKVPYSIYRESVIEAYGSIFTEEELHKQWDDIKLPTRSTKKSAGYDFYCPFDITVTRSNIVDIPTGVALVTDRDDIFLMCVPRSGLGFKKGLGLRNTIGVIDADYCQSDNYGHIKARLVSEEDCELVSGKAFMQGIIIPFLKVDDDAAKGVRNGGFGSTDRQWKHTPLEPCKLVPATSLELEKAW